MRTGDLLTSHDVDEAAIEKMKLAGDTVVVLGGSKSSIDMLVLLHKAGVPTRWIARKVGIVSLDLICIYLNSTVWC